MSLERGILSCVAQVQLASRGQDQLDVVVSNAAIPACQG